MQNTQTTGLAPKTHIGSLLKTIRENIEYPRGLPRLRCPYTWAILVLWVQELKRLGIELSEGQQRGVGLTVQALGLRA